MRISNLVAFHQPYQLIFDFERIFGHGKLDFAVDRMRDETDFEFNALDGRIQSPQGVASKIRSFLNIKQGSLFNSYAEGCFGDLQGYLTFGTEEVGQIKIFLKGGFQEILKQIPDPLIRDKLYKTFDQYELNIVAELKHLKETEK